MFMAENIAWKKNSHHNVSLRSELSCDVRYDFHMKTMFGSSLPPVVCRRAHALFTLFVFACA